MVLSVRNGTGSETMLSFRNTVLTSPSLRSTHCHIRPTTTAEAITGV